MTCVVRRWLILVFHINSDQTFLSYETSSCAGTDDRCQSSSVCCLRCDHTWARAEISRGWLMSLVIWSWKGVEWSWAKKACWPCHLTRKRNSGSLLSDSACAGEVLWTPEVRPCELGWWGEGCSCGCDALRASPRGRAVKLWCITGAALRADLGMEM